MRKDGETMQPTSNVDSPDRRGTVAHNNNDWNAASTIGPKHLKWITRRETIR